MSHHSGDAHEVEEAVNKALGAYELAMRVGFPILLGACSWLFTSHMSHEQRLTRIRGVAVHPAGRAA